MTHRAVCGYWLGAMLVVVAVGGLFGCGGEQPEGGETQTSAEEPAGDAGTRTGDGDRPASATPAAPMPAPIPAPADALDSGATTPSAEPDLQEPQTPLPKPDVTALPIKLQMKIGATHNRAERDWQEIVAVGELGALYYVHGFHEAAVQSFRRASETQPGELAWRYYLGLAQDRAGQYDQAIASYQEFLKEAPDYQPARIRWARILLEEQGRHEPAAGLLEAVVEAEPNNVAALFGLGKCALAAGQPDEARRHFQRVLGISPGYAPAHAALGELLENAGEEDQAAAHRKRGGDDDSIAVWGDTLAAAVRQRGLDVDALLGLANTFLEQNEPAGAEAQLRLIMGIEPENVAARTLLGAVRVMQDQAEKGAELLREVLAEQGAYVPAQIELGVALTRMGNLDEAEEMLRTALAQEPRNIRALQRLCAALAQQEQVDEAVQAVQEFEQRVDDDGRLLLQVAELYRQLDHRDQSLAALQRAIELEPGMADARFALGVALSERGDQSGARAQWEAALEAAPTYLPARGMLINLLREEGDYERVKRLLEEGLDLQPGMPQILNDLAWMLATCPEDEYRNGARAVELAEQAARITRYQDHSILDTLAAAYAEAGRFEDARKWINEAQRQARAARNMVAANQYAQRSELYAAEEPYRVSR